MVVQLELSQMDIDAIKEVANIGTGQASMALSTLFNQRVDIGLPKTEIIKLADLHKSINSSEAMIGIYSSIKEGIFGNILMVIPVSSALNLTNKLHGKSGTRLENEDVLVLSKIGSILNSSYLTGVAQLLGERILFHPPHVMTIIGDSIVDFLSVHMAEDSKMLLVNIDFVVKEYDVRGGVMLLLTIESLYPLLQRLKSQLS
jgi:chemotaxis protein CheC